MQQYPQTSQRSIHRASPTIDSDATNFHPPNQSSGMVLATEDQPNSRSSAGSARSSHSRRQQNPQQQLSQIEKSVTHLLVATKQLLETLTLWSRGTATEGEVSDVYVRLGYEFNIASRAFNAIGVDTQDLGNVPELLRGILEETLSQEASQASLDRYLPRIRDIIINLLKGLKKKQQRLRQRRERENNASGSGGPNGTSPRQGSIGAGSVTELDDPQSRNHPRPPPHRQSSSDTGTVDLPPRSTSVAGRSSPSKYDLPANPKVARTTPNRDTASSDSSVSSNAMQHGSTISPYPQEETMPQVPDNRAPPYVDFPPPPPPPKQQDALAALQRGGELERRASRRFSAYQIQKHLGGTNGIPVIPPPQNSPVPNRGKDMRDSMNAVRTRGSQLHSRQRSTQRRIIGTSPNRNEEIASRRISEESAQSIRSKPPRESVSIDSPLGKLPESEQSQIDTEKPLIRATLSAPLDESVELPAEGDETVIVKAADDYDLRQTKTPSPQPEHFIPEQSPQPGKELTLFLQYKSKIKKFVLSDGYNDLTIARLQLAFIEKFAWNTHSNGDLPDIYIQDPISGVRHELEDLSDIKDRCVLVLNIESLDEVKRHIDDGIGGLRRVVEGIKSSMDNQQVAIQRISDRQQEAAKEMAGLAAAPSLPSNRVSTILLPTSKFSNSLPADSQAQLNEVQSLRRDLAIVRQTYTSFVADIEANMTAIRSKASAVKSTAIDASIPKLKGDSGRAYVNAGKKTLGDDSEKIVTRVDDLQDMIEDLRKDVVTRGVRPLPRQLETVAKDLSLATAELRKLREFLKKEKPIWTKVWEQELQTVCEERDYLTMQEELANDLEDDLEKAGSTFALVEQATKQQNVQSQNGARSASGRNLHAIAMDKAIDPRAAKDGVLGEVKALQPNHESRLEAIERAEKARQRELESRRGDEFQKELGTFVDEGRLKKSGGVEETDRMRNAKDERIRKEVWEKKNAKVKTTTSEETEADKKPTIDEAAASVPVPESGGPPIQDPPQADHTEPEPTPNEIST